MLTKKCRLEFGKTGTAKVLFSGDWHIGTDACHIKGVAKFIEAAKRTPWVGMADFMEAITPGDKRFTIDEHGKTSLMGQWALAQRCIASASKTCLGLVSGNHEAAVSKTIGSMSKLLAEQTGVTYLTQTAFLCMSGGAKATTVYVAHGTLVCAGRSGDERRADLNKRIRLRDYLSAFEADLKVIGHGHQFICSPPMDKRRLVPGYEKDGSLRRPVEVEKGWCVMTPALVRVYTEDCETWAQSRLFSPADLGWVEAVIDKSLGIVAVNHIDENGIVVKTVEREVLS